MAATSDHLGATLFIRPPLTDRRYVFWPASTYDGALKVLNLVDLEKLGGSWRGSMRLSRGRTLEAAGRKADALKSYRDMVTDESASESHRRVARQAAAALEPGN